MPEETQTQERSNASLSLQAKTVEREQAEERLKWLNQIRTM